MPTMPNLSGLNYQEAQDALEAAGIYVAYPAFAFLSQPQITVTWQSGQPSFAFGLSGFGLGEFGASQAPGLVLSQTPQSGASVAKGAPINLTIGAFPMGSVIG